MAEDDEVVGVDHANIVQTVSVHVRSASDNMLSLSPTGTVMGVVSQAADG
jgi:hypothetical protein